MKRSHEVMSGSNKSVTVTAPSNIAVIKYWGKRDEERILPINGSISVTLDENVMGTITSAASSQEWEGDALWLNDEPESLDTKRMRNCLTNLRPSGDNSALRIASRNNFPTAAGLASSASGYAALVYALGQLYDYKEPTPGYLTAIARQGSGSACRSLMGGFVEWKMGEKEDGSDSYAVQVAPAAHWPEMTAVVCVVSAKKKGVSSTSGMQTSVQTSELLSHRAKEVVPGRLEAMRKAILDKDFESFATLTMQDSNQFHSTCLDTWPPIFYMNDTSRHVVQAVHSLNKQAGRSVCAYTFDAGPNAVIFTLKNDLPAVMKAVLGTFPPATGTDMAQYVNDASALAASGASSPEQCAALGPVSGIPQAEGGSLHRLIVSAVGHGPSVLPESSSLLAQDGQPSKQ